MSRLRRGLCDSRRPAIPNDTALYMIRDAVERRQHLIRGRLEDGSGGVCAIGAFFADNPRAVLSSALIDEVAGYNDSIISGSGTRVRRNRVLEWLRWKIDVLAGHLAVSA